MMSRQRSSEKRRRSLLVIPLLGLIAWYTLPIRAQNGESTPPILPPSSPDQIQYRYDAASGECRNAAGQKGTNGWVLASCADLTGANLKEFDLRGKDLAGVRLSRCRFGRGTA